MQFSNPIAEIAEAICQIGFVDAIEVAYGAMETTQREGAELNEKLKNGQQFMTTSCCPSYVELVNKHLPDMKPFVSHTQSPMYYTAVKWQKQNIRMPSWYLLVLVLEKEKKCRQ